jgi:putative NIF3 family GTP cyclohydrolase 1 type 2
MDHYNVSRRGLFLAGAGLAFGSAAPTAGQIIERIKQNVGVPWRAETVDKFVAGDAEVPVKGIATTMMATLDVIQRAAAAGKNLVITHEPTFWLHQDTVVGLEQNAVLQFKQDFIRKNNMAVFRFHDHWHAHRPDGIATGMARELGWEKNTDPQNPRLFTFPAIKLSRFAEDIRTKLNIRAMRVVGDPNLSVNKVAASWGAGSREGVISLLSRPEVDAVIIGEGREWEVVEYAQDAIAAGQKKALLILGHVASEQAGMKYCAEWLKTFISDVPVEFVAAAEPFWSPGMK